MMSHSILSWQKNFKLRMWVTWVSGIIFWCHVISPFNLVLLLLVLLLLESIEETNLSEPAQRKIFFCFLAFDFVSMNKR